MPTSRPDRNRQGRSGSHGKNALPTGSGGVNRQTGFSGGGKPPAKKGCRDMFAFLVIASAAGLSALGVLGYEWVRGLA